jgi:hypothetical protein
MSVVEEAILNMSTSMSRHTILWEVEMAASEREGSVQRWTAVGLRAITYTPGTLDHILTDNDNPECPLDWNIARGSPVYRSRAA